MSISLPCRAPAQANAPRERLLIDDGWLFTKDDPAGAEGKLAYPKVKDIVMKTGADLQDAQQDTGTLPAAADSDVGSDVSYTQ